MDRLRGALDARITSGWKDILRPIRDGLDDIRHRLPGGAHETPEDKQKRLVQRQSDVLRGFAYFESFEELHSWRPEHVDSLQRSTFPLIARATQSDKPGARVMVCHDFAGGYHAYESSAPNEVQEESFVLRYMQHVEVFVYFSHKLVTIPPPAWTNALHRNGVLSLGTFIVENRIPGHTLMLQSEKTSSGRVYPVAQKLAQMASLYGFDGWLINIEQAFSAPEWSLDDMIGFLRQLRMAMGDSRRVVWYDALTVTGKVSHQNAMNGLNSAFFDICDDILINYKWNESSLDASVAFANRLGFDTKRMYFGIDVWAQNQPRDRLHPRITYPKEAGGGTNTGVAVAKCAEYDVSACIFGPAWCNEHFSAADAQAITRAMWEGEVVSENVECDCLPGQSCRSGHHQTTRDDRAILEAATQFPAGSASFFWTDFVSPYSRVLDPKSQAQTTLCDIGSQSVLPLRWRDGAFTTGSLWSRLGEDAAGLLVGVPPGNTTSNVEILSAKLFHTHLHIPSDQRLELSVDYERIDKSWSPAFYLRLSTGSQIKLPLLEFHKTAVKLLIPRAHASSDLNIVELGVLLTQLDAPAFGTSNPRPSTPALRLFNIAILPRDMRGPDTLRRVPLTGSHHPAATHIRCLERGHHDDDTSATAPAPAPAPARHARLVWTLNEAAQRGPDDGLCHPRSEITGAMSHFEVKIAGELVQRVYGLEMVLPLRFAEMWERGEELLVVVDCVRFGGQRFRGDVVRLSRLEEEWEML